ncbi:MAG: flagellar motor switch protein FliN [Pseudohongiellaceae bacterium]
MTKADKPGRRRATDQTTASSENEEQQAPAADAPAPEAGKTSSATAPADKGAGHAAEKDPVFKPLDKDRKGDAETGGRDLEMVMDIPVKLNVQLGRTRMTIKQLLELTEGSVVELDGLAGDPMDIFINDYLVAQGEVVVVDDKYGIRITEIISPSERIHKLNR